jgi:hypothetical protein
MKTSPSKPSLAETPAGRSAKRHWFQITGLPGWKRAQLGVPAFGEADCSPPPELPRTGAKTVLARDDRKDKP